MWKSVRDAFGPGNPSSQRDSESPAVLFHRQPSLVSVKTDDRTGDALTEAAQAPLLAVKQENKNFSILPNGRFLAENFPLQQQQTCFYFCLSWTITNPQCWCFISTLPGGHPGCDILRMLSSETPHFPGVFFPYLGKPSLVFEHTSLPFPSRTSLSAQMPVMWSCGIWQDGRHRETARLTHHWHFLSLVEFVSYYLCQLMKVCILSKTLPASVPLLIYKTQSNLRIKQND